MILMMNRPVFLKFRVKLRRLTLVVRFRVMAHLVSLIQLNLIQLSQKRPLTFDLSVIVKLLLLFVNRPCSVPLMRRR